MSFDNTMAFAGFLVGVGVMTITNSIAKLPLTRRPWLHVGWGAVMAYTSGNLPVVEAWALKEHEKVFKAWKRRQARNDAVYAKLQARLKEADELMAADPALLSHKEGHGEHVLKFYRPY